MKKSEEKVIKFKKGTEFIPVFRPSITQAEIDAVTEVMRSGWLGLGPVTEKFEKALAKEFEVEHAIGVNSGTAALHLSLHLLDLKPDDEVIVPTITFVSTAHVVHYCGARVVFADVEDDTLCMNMDDVRRKITDRTRAVIPVHYGGHPCDMNGLREVIGDRKITIIEDASHACGAEYNGKKIGGLSPLTCFSFHAVKNLTCGEGGAVLTHNSTWARKLREMRWLGISKDTFTRSSRERVYAWQYWVNELGFKYHLHDISAAIGIVQLKRLKENNLKRRQVMERYNNGFSDHTWIETPPEQENVTSSWHIYHIKVPERDRLVAHLKRKGIAPGVHYYPIHMHPYYAPQNAQCPIAEEIWKRIISLPLFPDLREDEINRVIEAVISFEGSI
ncbi:MAG: DegT/DnrJ/EryC1/StrS aminotransferase family protein [Candidatus Omnitrophota bacterium]|jgi:perosamine synthetase|nr:MAG: DegT/DnrJ/EryC1/StrS aminotransferase family protein [Candidatus Omnitrophota bacterium]